ncbi:MAG: family 78 glycoside hydrolase catalytic domain [Candidatus Merdivicinus sp.]
MNHLSPFSGKWICAAEFADLKPLQLFHREHEPFTEPEHAENLKNFHIVVRKNFDRSIVANANDITMRITADDYYKLYINGEFVGQGPAPGYYFSYYYNEFEISRFLRDGQNRIEVQVYYQGLINRVWNSADYRQGMIAEILADGRPVLTTDESWEYARDLSYIGMRTTGYKTNYLEDVDSRISLSEWNPMRIVDADYTFCSKPVPALQVYEQLPTRMEEWEGVLFIDFGQEITGGLRIQAAGHDGDRVTIHCGEELNPDGSVRWKMRCNCDYEEFWTLKEGENTLNQYDYKAFRYVELSAEGDVSFEKVSAVVRHYPFPENAADLRADNKILEDVFTICRNGVKYGAQESFLDCPSREKGQYTGDMTITGASHLLLTADPSLLRRAIEVQVDSLRIAPGMMAVAPGSFMQEIADYSLQFPLSVWRYYQYTGDREFLERMVEPCRNILEYFGQYAREDGLLDGVTGKWNLVDWPKNLRDDYDFPLEKPIGPGAHNVMNAFYVGCVQTVEQIETELGIPSENRAVQLKEAFNRAFFRPELGRYVDSETSTHSAMHSNCIPAFYGLIPEGYAESVGDYLVNRGMVCGVYMAYFLLKALARMGRYEDVWNFLVSEEENSWYNMVREGGTTCFEAWGVDKKWNTSLCHPWASAPISVLIEDLAGLNPEKPGTDWNFHPHFPEKAGSLCLRVPTPEGMRELSL